MRTFKAKPKSIKKKLQITVVFLLSVFCTHATTRTTVASGNWNVPNTWSPNGVPTGTDNVIIASGHTITVRTNETVKDVTVNSGGILTWANGNTLTLQGNLTVNGTVMMNGGNINLSRSGLLFTLGANSSFTWEPGTNTVAGATLFTNGIESFAPTSSLIIKKWYNYQIALGSVVTGNFGNLELNSLNGTSIYEWNQNNQFQAHLIVGSLSIDQGWITLDKSGTISNTTIGSIILKNANSSFYGHNGTHPSAFTITTSSVTNNGGNFYSLNDGNGNTTVHVTGNFNNTGNVKIINNSGVAGVSNGNATMIVDGTFSQSIGDTRIIYNVATTNSGLFTSSFGNLNLAGGIFMGQTACTISGGVCSLSILHDFTINYLNATDKFRATSISSIGTVINNAKLNLSVGGNLSISGNISAEVTSSASSGIEAVQVNGNTNIQGCTVNFNYGASTAAHSHSFQLNGNLNINGGNTFLSRNNGNADITINGNLNVASGSCTAKAADSLGTLNVGGNFTQTGGTFYLHNSSTVASSVPTIMSVAGDFMQSAGTFNFETYNSNSSPSHILNLKGVNVTLSGTGLITHSGAGSSTVFGILNYCHNGQMNFSRTANSHLISQVKQVIANGCILNVLVGNIQVASHSNIATDYFKVATGGVLKIGNGQLFSSGSFQNSGMQVDSGATISLQRAAGFFDGTQSGCINASNNFNCHLHPFSIVEYCGSLPMGIGLANAQSNTYQQPQYGILKINLSSSSGKVLLSNSITVVNKLILARGELNLNGNTLTISNGAVYAISRTDGYINAEMNMQMQPGKIVWKNMNLEQHEFPFGVDASSYVPVIFSPLAGAGNDVSISTYYTSNLDNTPYPITSNGVINFTNYGANYALNNVIDRWWNISATGITANVSISYRSVENTLSASLKECTINLFQWNGTGWDVNPRTTYGVQMGVGTAFLPNVTSFSAWALAHLPFGSACRTIPATFNAELITDKVSLTWICPSETIGDLFIIERSSDGITFEEISRKQATVNSSTELKYSAIDEQPLAGTSYYRLKQENGGGNATYSELRTVVNKEQAANALSIENFGPNPFTDKFSIDYKINNDGLVTIQLSNSGGQLVSESRSAESKGTHRYEYSQGGSLQEGIYFVKIIFNDKVATQKLIKK